MSKKEKRSPLAMYMLAFLTVLLLTAGVLIGRAAYHRSSLNDPFDDARSEYPGSMGKEVPGDPDEAMTVPSFLTEPETTDPPDSDPLDTDSPEIDPPETTDPPETDPQPPKPPKPGYDYTKAVPASDPVNDSYFADAVFIGDSRTVGMGMYGKIKSNYYAKVSLNIISVLNTKFLTVDGYDQQLTVLEALKAHPGFTKIYVGFGINELGYNVNYFINCYKNLIGQIRAIYPNAVIYVLSVFPVSRAVSEKSQFGVNNTAVLNFNCAILNMAQEMGLYFLDTYTLLADEDGALPDGISSDGIHLGPGKYSLMVSDYLRTHTVPENGLPAIEPKDDPPAPETTEPPETDPPETQPPETQPPETEPPETQPPETKPPETQPPETEPPETQPPETNPPETIPPETEPPETDPPETTGEPETTEPPVIPEPPESSEPETTGEPETPDDPVTPDPPETTDEPVPVDSDSPDAPEPSDMPTDESGESEETLSSEEEAPDAGEDIG